MDKEKLLEFIRRQAEVEEEIVESLNRSLDRVDNPAVRNVLKGISYDSLKHADMYRSIDKLLTEPLPPLSHESLLEQRELIEKHIRYEEKLIEEIERVLPEIDDEKVKLVLKAILADEKRHHELLKKVLEVIVRAEAVSPQDLWDLIWRDVPFHGTPGG